MPLPSQLESQYAYPGTGESFREIVYIRYRVAFLDGFSDTSGINPCSSMLMAAAGVGAGASGMCVRARERWFRMRLAAQWMGVRFMCMPGRMSTM